MMRGRHWTTGDGRRLTALTALTALAALAALASGSLASVGSPGAETPSGSGGAFGESVNVSLPDASTVTSGPLPSVTLPVSNRRVKDDAPSVTVAREGPSAPFGGRLLETGGLSVAARLPRRAAAPTSSATVGQVSALGGILAAEEAGSRCGPGGTGVIGSARLKGASLRLSGTETVALPTDPAPNTTFEGRDDASGDTFTVTVNQQEAAGGSVTVTAAHIVLRGPTAAGDIMVAQSRCAVSGAAPPSPAAPQAPPAAAASSQSAAVPVGLDRSDAATRLSPPAPLVAPRVLGAATGALASQSGAQETGPGAYGYSANISLFGGPQPPIAPTPTVALPAAGSATPVTATAPSAVVKFGPATFLTSGRIDVSTMGTPGSVTSSTKIASLTGNQGEVLTADSVESTCTGSTGSTTITNERLQTDDNQDTGAPPTYADVPNKPGVGFSINGHIHPAGLAADNFTLIFNEQTKGADGSITVTAVHLKLLGPVATGDLLLGVSRCGAGGGDAGAGVGSGAGVSSRAGGGTTIGARGTLATTGADVVPLVLVALALVVAGSAVLVVLRRRQSTQGEAGAPG